MKKLFCIIFLFLLASRPVYHLSYIIYFGYNIEAIVDKYCVNKDEPELHCNGNCHLIKKIELNSNSKDKATINSFSSAFYPVYKEEIFCFNFKEFYNENKADKNWKYIPLRKLLVVSKNEQPPDFFV